MAGVKGRSGTNRGKDKPYAEALRMELADAGDNHKVLRQIARKHIELAQAGDLPAIKEIADRLDGKPAQAIIGGDEDDPAVKMVHRIERAIVDPKHSDSAGV